MRERERWGSEWVRERGRLLKREREKDVESMRTVKEKEKSLKNRCAKIVCPVIITDVLTHNAFCVWNALCPFEEQGP